VKYSVYRPELKVYDYYETSPSLGDVRNPPTDDVARRCPRDKALGVASGLAGYRLPLGARKIGQGEAPQGMIVTASTGGVPLGSAITDEKVPTWVFYGGLGVALYALWDGIKK
jgi:hypothetical protein